MRMLHIRYALFVLIFAGQAFPQTPDETMLNRILDWSDSLSTFSGQYELMEEGEIKGQRQIEIVYRFQGEDFYLEARPNVVTDYTEIAFSRLNGIGETRIIQGENGTVHGTINIKEKHQLPLGAYILPNDAYGWLNGTNLRQRTNNGIWKIYQEDTKILFSQRTPGKGDGIDIWFDDALRPLEIEHVYWFNSKGAELTELATSDPFRLTYVRARISLANYTEVGGIQFPLSIARTDFTVDDAQMEAANSAYKENKITLGQLYLTKFDSAKTSSSITRTMRVDFNPAMISVNEPLSEADFRLVFPEGSRIGDATRNAAVSSEPTSKVSERYWSAFIAGEYPILWYAIVLLPFPLVVAAIFVYFKKRAPHRAS